MKVDPKRCYAICVAQAWALLTIIASGCVIERNPAYGTGETTVSSETVAYGEAAASDETTPGTVGHSSSTVGSTSAEASSGGTTQGAETSSTGDAGLPSPYVGLKLGGEGTLWGSAAATLSCWVDCPPPSNREGWVSFGGHAGYFVTGAEPQESYTLTAWIQPASGGYQHIVGSGAWQVLEYEGWLFFAAGEWSIGPGISTEEPSFFTLRVSGASVSLFVNGQLEEARTFDDPAQTALGPDLRLGIRRTDDGYPDIPFAGLMQDVRVYAELLDETTLLALYEAGPGGA